MKKDRINKKDIGLAEDYFETLKHLVGYESHCAWDFIGSQSEKDLKKWITARENRTYCMDFLIDFLKVDLKGQEWCELKHLLRIAMGIEEIMNRINKDKKRKEDLKKFSKMHDEIYLQYLKILGFNEKNAEVMSSA